MTTIKIHSPKEYRDLVALELKRQATRQVRELLADDPASWLCALAELIQVTREHCAGVLNQLSTISNFVAAGGQVDGELIRRQLDLEAKRDAQTTFIECARSRYRDVKEAMAILDDSRSKAA
jgi:hypothetical protein